MAYLAFAETAGGHVVETALHRMARPAPEASFTALEWSVVAIAQRDRLSSLRTPGRMSVALGAVFGSRTNPRLADERLEALRRIAVLSWYRGYAVAPSEVRAFVAAGYSLDHYEMLLESIGVARTAQNQRSFR